VREVAQGENAGLRKGHGQTVAEADQPVAELSRLPRTRPAV
jgi:hypothetical protein